MNIIRFDSKLIIIAAFILLIILIAGCAAPTVTPVAIDTPVPTIAPPVVDTPVPAVMPVTGGQPVAVVATIPPTVTKDNPKNSVRTLTDGSKIILQSDALVELISIPAIGATKGEVQVLLTRGVILVIPKQENGLWFSVKNLNGYAVKVKGCSMIVSVDPKTKDFGMKCLGSECEASNATGEKFKVEIYQGWSFVNGIFRGPEIVKLDELKKAFGEYLPACIEAIPVTGGLGAEATINAKATDSCGAFKSQFPGTPCP